MTSSHDPRQPFTREELTSIRSAVGHLHEFAAGYVFIRGLREQGLTDQDPHLDYFFETSLIAYLDGLYPPNRTEAGILPVLRLVGCNTLADELEAALDRPVGSSTYAKLIRRFRNKAIIHPEFGLKPMQQILDDAAAHLERQEDIDAFSESAATLQERTAALYVWFRETYPELVAHADSIE